MIFISTELPLILKACKASHSVITVSLESRFSRNSSIAITRKKKATKDIAPHSS